MRYEYCQNHYFTRDKDGVIHIYPDATRRTALKSREETVIPQVEAHRLFNEFLSGKIHLHLHHGSLSPFDIKAHTTSSISYRLTGVPQKLHSEISLIAKEKGQSLNSVIIEKISRWVNKEEKVDRRAIIDEARALGSTGDNKSKDILISEIPPELHAKIKRAAYRKRLPLKLLLLFILKKS